MKLKHTLNKAAMATVLVCLLPGAAHALTLEDLAERMDRIEQENQILRAENQRLQQQIQKTQATAEAASVAAESVATSMESVEKVADFVDRSEIGGYGELHYNNLNGSGGASDKDEIDFHRFVLFFSHQFTDDIRFFSEIELEHSIAGHDENGEVELEQAYIDFDLNDQVTARGGLFLLPVGIINETHEPPTFYGVERNPVEKDIIPATWWAGGAGLMGHFASGFSVDAYVHSGLKTSMASNYSIRSGRQKVSEADAESLATTARVRWTGMPGVELAASVQYQDDITQESDTTAGSATLLEAHAIYSQGPFTLKALYAQWDLDGSGPKSVGADRQDGYYIEPSYRVNDKLGFFARYNEWDKQAGSNSGVAMDSGKKQWDLGVNFWPHPDVVIKADYQDQDNDNGQNQDGFNLGIGYQF